MAVDVGVDPNTIPDTTCFQDKVARRGNSSTIDTYRICHLIGINKDKDIPLFVYTLICFSKV